MDQRNVLVTGGASGIGAEIARQFCELGDRVTVFDRIESKEVPQSLIGDVRSPDDHQRAVSMAAPDGRLDVLIANAGVHDGGRGLMEGSIEDLATSFQQVLDINVLGYLLAARAASEALHRAQGTLILTLSDASFDVRGNGAGIAYVASKHAGLGLCRVLARELGPDVRVNAVAPGGVATGLSVEGTAGTRRVITDGEALERRLEERTILRRGATLSEIAGTYTFLASAAAGAMTGQVLRVDGGLLQ